MTAHLFFLSEAEKLVVGSETRVVGSEFKHAKVRRIDINEQILLADRSGNKYLAIVKDLNKDALTCEILEVLQAELPNPEIIIIQALAKNGRDEQAIESCTEVGAHTFIPWQANRTIVKWDTKKQKKMLQKWENVVTAAAKQARRAYVPKVTSLHTTKQLIQTLKDTKIYVLHEDATESLAKVIKHNDEPIKKIAFIIGPEGGITHEELKQFSKLDGLIVSVSNHVLRSSNAAVVALAQFQVLQD
ncbi:MAG: 16S rRNA (uracil(1498)-N(3))-methyltransferase [Micrococcaceae bacterium]